VKIPANSPFIDNKPIDSASSTNAQEQVGPDPEPPQKRPRLNPSGSQPSMDLRPRLAAMLPPVGPLALAEPAHAEVEPRRSSPDVQHLQDVLRLCKERRAKEDPRIELAAALSEHGYGPMLKDLKLSRQYVPLKGLDLSGMTFDNCEFDWNYLSKSIMQDCEFRNCTFRNASFMHSQLRDCAFKDCQFVEVMMVNTKLSGVLFERCGIAASSFEDARIQNGCKFREVTLPGTHFLSAAVSDCCIEKSDLTDTVFFGTEQDFDIDAASKTTAKLTKPTTATLIFPEERGVSVPRVGAKISGIANTLPLRVAMRAPTLDVKAVDAEVERFLEGLSDAGGDRLQPVAQRLVIEAVENPQALPNASRVIAKARTLVEHVDSVVLPGGEDVSPKLYGHQQAPENDWKGDYRRSLLELGLVHYCFHRGVPLMAICRGFQMTGIYFGASLHQHVGQQVGVRILDEDARESESTTGQMHGIYGRTLKDIRAAVYHHQAVDADSGIENLHASLRRTIVDAATGNNTWKVIMAFESSETRAPIIGLQFHPEFFNEGVAPQDSAALDNKRLEAMANAYVQPNSNTRGFRDPRDMVASGILDHLSPGNDELWRILSNAAKAHRIKAGITPEALVSQRERLSAVDPTGSSATSRGRALSAFGCNAIL